MLCLNRAIKRTHYRQFLEEYIAALTHFTLHRLYFSHNTSSYETHYLFWQWRNRILFLCLLNHVKCQSKLWMLVLQILLPPGKILNINSIHIRLQNELILHTSHRSKVHRARYLWCVSISQVLPLGHVLRSGKFTAVVSAALKIIRSMA